MLTNCGDANLQAPWRERPQEDPGTGFAEPLQNPAPGLFTRTSDAGVIAVNTVTHTATFPYAPAGKAVVQPQQFSLAQNYPNPFNLSTAITFALPAAGPVSLRIYDVAGQVVRELITGTLPAGQHRVAWDGRNARGAAVSSGVYLYELHAGTRRAVRRMVMVK